MNDPMVEDLRVYSRRLVERLRDKEVEVADLQEKFSKLQGRYSQLDYAFRKNLELHQHHMMEIYDLRLSRAEQNKTDENHRRQFYKMENQLINMTKEKEVAKSDLAYWKQSLIDQKQFYEGKYEEYVREFELRIYAAEAVHQKTLKETQISAEKQIQTLVNRWKTEEEKAEEYKRKEIMLQGDVDVLRHRTQELANLIEAFPETNDNVTAILSCIAKVLRSLNITKDDYENRLTLLNQELNRKVLEPAINPDEDISDYKTLKSQNLVLREVVKKLKSELTRVQKNGEVVLKSLAEDSHADSQEKELAGESSSKNSNKQSPPAENDVDTTKSEIRIWKGTAEQETNSDFMKSSKYGERTVIPNGNCNSGNSIALTKPVHTFKEFESEEGLSFDGDESQEAYWEIRKGPVQTIEDRETRDYTKGFEFNSEPLGSRQDRRLVNENLDASKNRQLSGKVNAQKLQERSNEDRPICQGRLEPIESHQNSILYKEYTIAFSKSLYIKVRHPTSRRFDRGKFQLRSASSEKEYQEIPIDQAVLFLNFKNGNVFSQKLKTTNCSIQTLPISTASVFTQTIKELEENLPVSQARNGVKILNSEWRAMERSVRDLEKTVSEACEETLGDARSMILNSKKFPPSEKFFDCVRYLSQCRTT